MNCCRDYKILCLREIIEIFLDGIKIINIIEMSSKCGLGCTHEFTSTNL